tara:strand:+ start:1661 stop:2155 length:495 start_codon:yes stop_codon:yes gene_type:complete
MNNSIRHQNLGIYDLVDENQINDDKIYKGDNILYNNPIKITNSPTPTTTPSITKIIDIKITKKHYKGDTVINNLKQTTNTLTPTPTTTPKLTYIFDETQYDISEKKVESILENIINVSINFLKTVDHFFYNINYDNTYVQIAIIICIFYIITTLIGTLHININI